MDQLIADEYGVEYCYSVVPNPEFLSGAGCQRSLPTPPVIYDLTREHPQPSRTFQLVLMLEVLEHLLADDELVLTRLHSLVEPGGYVCISVPNVARHVNRLKILMGINPLQPKREIVSGGMGGYGHIREYTVGEVRRMLSNEFEVLELTAVNPYGSPRARQLLDILPRTLRSTILAVGRAKR